MADYTKSAGHEKRERILTLDILRGFFILVMAVDHLGYFPSVFESFTGRAKLWSSAAEGFFIISGILVGFVYRPRILISVTQTFKKLWGRALKLYLWSIALTLLFVLWGNIIGPDAAKPGLWLHPQISDLFLKTLGLVYTYGWADFLRYYVAYLIFAPFGLLLLRQRKGWLVIGLSVGVWAFRNTNFFLAWQLLFMFGIVIGYYLPELESWFKTLKKRRKNQFKYSVFILTLLTITVSFCITYLVPNVIHLSDNTLGSWLYELDRNQGGLLDKWTLGPGRAFIAFLWFSSIYLIVRPYEKIINIKTKRFFLLLGQNALFIYGAHAVLLFGIHAYRVKLFGFALNTLYTAVFISTLYLVVRIKLISVNKIKSTGH